eukprot:gene17280-biopygen6830
MATTNDRFTFPPKCVPPHPSWVWATLADQWCCSKQQEPTSSRTAGRRLSPLRRSRSGKVLLLVCIMDPGTLSLP